MHGHWLKAGIGLFGVAAVLLWRRYNISFLLLNYWVRPDRKSDTFFVRGKFAIVSYIRNGKECFIRVPYLRNSNNKGKRVFAGDMEITQEACIPYLVNPECYGIDAFRVIDSGGVESMEASVDELNK